MSREYSEQAPALVASLSPPPSTRQVSKRRRLRCPRRVQGAQPPPGGTACPLVPKNVGGRSGRDSGAGQARPSAVGGRRPQQAHPSPIPAPASEEASAPPPLQNANDCAIVPHEVGSRPAFLSRSLPHTLALWANYRESPCGRGAEGTTQGARPSEEGWDRSQCRYKAQALWSHPAPLRFRYGSLRSHYGSFTVPLRFLYGLLRPITPLLRLRAYTHRNPAD